MSAYSVVYTRTRLTLVDILGAIFSCGTKKIEILQLKQNISESIALTNVLKLMISCLREAPAFRPHPSNR